MAQQEYVWLPLDFAGDGGQAWALPLALVTDAGTAGPRLHYIHTDHLGTPVAMTSAGLAQLEWQATLRPFGEAHAITGTESLALRLPGQFFDPETGYHQNWHRDYDPRLGRYLQSDPIGLGGGLNTFAYVAGDPVNLVDLQGLQEALLRSLPLAGGAAAADGPLPVGDAIALGLLGGALVYDICRVDWDIFFSDESNLADKIGKIAKETGLTPCTSQEGYSQSEREYALQYRHKEPRRSGRYNDRRNLSRKL